MHRSVHVCSSDGRTLCDRPCHRGWDVVSQSRRTYAPFWTETPPTQVLLSRSPNFADMASASSLQCQHEYNQVVKGQRRTTATHALPQPLWWRNAIRSKEFFRTLFRGDNPQREFRGAAWAPGFYHQIAKGYM